MRHRVAGRHLGRETSHRMALYRNLVTDLLRYDRITTTEAKAKEIRPMAERIITLGRRGDLHARRQATRFLYDTRVVKKVFDEIGPAMRDRPGGYLRITGLEPRKGDGARMAAIELVTYVDAPPTPRPSRVTATPAAASPARAAAATAVAAGEPEAEPELAHTSFENRIVDQRENLIEPTPAEEPVENEAEAEEAEAQGTATAEASNEAEAMAEQSEAEEAAQAEAADASDVNEGEGESGT